MWLLHGAMGGRRRFLVSHFYSYYETIEFQVLERIHFATGSEIQDLISEPYIMPWRQTVAYTTGAS